MFMGVLAVSLSGIVSALITIWLVVQKSIGSDNQSFVHDISGLLISGFQFYYLLSCFISAPVFIFVTLGSYIQFMMTYDSLIDHYWKNPKISGR